MILYKTFSVETAGKIIRFGGACLPVMERYLQLHFVLSPKLSSAVSLNPFLEEAVNEVVDKILSEPIRPHFALGFVGPSFVMAGKQTLNVLLKQLNTPFPRMFSLWVMEVAIIHSSISKYYLAGVALLFARDINKPLGVGETEFHVMLSTGVSPVGPTYKANIIEDEELSMHRLTATRETVPQHLGYAILDDLRNHVGEIIQFPVTPLYVGVTKSRRIADGTERVREMQFHELHKVLKF